ncbi:MAG TPA: hypothetical protein VKM94_14560 [Blastocatellia bacterium]|nr:hypothetical protein [Blastocatellia bacterium]HMG35158.1 hypothetical protein [Blastocatellia bacterium]
MRAALVVSFCLAVLGWQAWKPEIPRVWDDEAVHELTLPLVGLDRPAEHVSADYYYRIPVTRIPKTYPVYAPRREPADYLEWLKQQEPEDAIDFRTLKSKEDWIQAGQLVFDAPFRATLSIAPTAEQWREFNGSRLYPRPAKDGTYPWVRYYVVKKGDVRGFFTECGSCHSRVLEDGTLVPGAQGNMNENVFHTSTLRGGPFSVSLAQWLKERKRSYSAPWLTPNPADDYEGLSLAQAVQVEQSIPPGTMFRAGTSHFYPPKMPSLIGVAERKYLDATGLVRHRSIGDLMRYATLIDVAENLTNFDGFRPAGELPPPESLGRYSDEALYALALYVYSLQPPPNPNKANSQTGYGEQVFKRESCGVCHSPPHYTNNMLMPADGFNVPEQHQRKFAILPLSVGTDTRLTLRSRKGTGYYRVPSLKGVWYRGSFEHNGSVLTLEDWFDPKRLRADYVPTGFKAYGVKTRAVKGHEFGLKLSAEDKKSLIAFLNTL